MSILKIKSKDFELELTSDGEVLEQTASQAQTPDATLDMALIAMALNEYGTAELHDYESGVITLKPQKSEWSSKILGLNKGINTINK
jgi:hypothetical protein